MSDDRPATPRVVLPAPDSAPASVPVAALPSIAGLAEHGPLRAAVRAACRPPEALAVRALLEDLPWPDELERAVQARALALAAALRERRPAIGRDGLVQGLLQEYALSSKEGVALMCLAEALLRIPDWDTRDALIRDKIADGRWREHLGRSASPFVNAATWGLMLTGRLVATHSEDTLSAALTRLIARGGEPLVRRGVDAAMRLLGEHFVSGRTIGEALARAGCREAQGFRHSYDMLGEAALTAADARRYREAYEQAIEAIGGAAGGRGVIDGPGISIKLSALHPRYGRAQQQRVAGELYPVLHDLARRACAHDIGMNIDAEEADRLELSLDLLERLCAEPDLAGWHGIGFVVQAYQKRCPPVIDWLVDLARRSGHRLMVRLVKGAYWDSEIKRAQVDGLDDYPVYTRKVHTDLSYLACARRLLAATDVVYPQFATHNAHTLAAIHEMADPSRWQPGQYEFQCLHGMGEPLYEQVVGAGRQARPCRIYAPVGTHETLLAYLVRRLLENGANTSFVNQVADRALPLERLVRSPVRESATGSLPPGTAHPGIVLPAALYGARRRNAPGLDLADDTCLAALRGVLGQAAGIDWRAWPAIAGGRRDPASTGEWLPVRNPADLRDTAGRVREATDAEVDEAVGVACGAGWSTMPAVERAARLEAAADALQARLPVLLGLLAREAGKTLGNGVAEVREAVDFLREYAAQVRERFDDVEHRPLGPVACISPWNFPLAIFVGQVAGALAAGNPVLAKPAEQTPLVAAEAVRLMHAAGVPADALQLLPGRGETVGARLVADPRVQGVLFTGSTEVARRLQQVLARRLGAGGMPVPLVAETGGQNAMVVDSSALAEQVVADVIVSAFDSAGQRCSALRLLCLQHDVADRVLTMLEGAMAELRLGNPLDLATDIGPVIDDDARQAIERHLLNMAARGHRVRRPVPIDAGAVRHGTFVAPALVEIDSPADVEHEVFGPVLHVLRHRREDLDRLVDSLNATGYALTFGVHSRIDETVDRVLGGIRAGNCYVNRNLIGAVVGVQPFGGEGLSGTGPKAGGPLYLLRLLSRRPADALVRAWRTVAPGAAGPPMSGERAVRAPLALLQRWAEDTGHGRLAATCRGLRARTPGPGAATLPGPTGERNDYRLVPRRRVYCVAARPEDLLTQLAAVLAVGGRVAWDDSPASQALHALLPPSVRRAIAWAGGGPHGPADCDLALHHGSDAQTLSLLRRLAARQGPLVMLWSFRPDDDQVPLEALVVERSVSTNTAAAGGNASLMTLG